MSIDEYHIMEHPFGWKVEYYDGQAHFTPREMIVRTKICVSQMAFNKTYNLIQVSEENKPQIIECFYTAFYDSVEFCDWTEDQIRKHAEKNINNYFNGTRGKPLPISTIAFDPNSNKLAGLALFLINKEGYTELDLLFVMPSYKRKRIATDLVSKAENKLFEDGASELYSAYHVCNEESQNWHHAFGFKEIYDQLYIRHKYSYYKHEIWRYKELGLNEQSEKFEKERDWWFSQLEEMWRY